MARPIDEKVARLLALLFGAMMLSSGAGGVLASMMAWGQAAHPALLLVDASLAVLGGVTLIALGRFAAPVAHRLFVPLLYAIVSVGPAMVSLGHYGIGPKSVAVVVIYADVPILAVFLFRRAVAAGLIAYVLGLYAIVLAIQPGYSFAYLQFLFFAIALLAIAGTIGGLLNHQSAEAERLARFRRFLPQPVAEAVMSSGEGSLMTPHRRRIAVFFCDLRGFTRFSASNEPEDVVEVLDEYFHAVGELLHRRGATIGAFAGDGIMAYFGDPVISEDPAGQAVALATELRPLMALLIETWTKRGYRLGYGIGIAYGYATLGVVGFEGRHDYTPLGSVVNLAARLSDEARDGEVLLDDRTYTAIGERADATACALQLKGFEDPVHAHKLAADEAVITNIRRPFSA